MAKVIPISVAFGKAVKQARLKKGWTQDDLAYESGLDRSYISQIEGGLRNPSLPVIWDLAVNLDTSLLTLMAAAIQLMPEASSESNKPSE